MGNIFKIFFILLLATTSTYAINNKDTVNIQLQWKHQFQFAGYYIAKEKGYYSDNNLNVNIKEYRYGTNVVDKVLSGDVEFGVGRSSLVLEKLHHKNLFLLAAILQNSPFILLAKEKDNLKSIIDLRNKKIMLLDDNVDMSSINIMLQVNGISSNDYLIQKHTFNVQDLIDNKIDVIAAYISNEPYFLQKKNIPYIIFNPKDYGFNFYNDILFTTSDYIKKNPKTVDAFYTASIKGWEYAFSHIEETAKFIFNNYNTQNKSLEHLIFEGKELKKLAYNKTDKLGTINKKTIMKLVDAYKLIGYTTNNEISLDDFIYSKALPEEKFNFNSILKIITIFIFVILIFVILNYKLKRLVKKKTIELEELNINLEKKVKDRTSTLNELNTKINNSIKYASLIQASLMHNDAVMKPFFKENFIIWQPKDTVGGDIWLFEELRDKDECLLCFIDCTGHGVPGALVTMIVKAIEMEIISIIKSKPDVKVSPAWVIGHFNKKIKKLLKQEDKATISNVGFDGGVIYYNKKTKILKFAGAETSLFYTERNGELKVIKGDRHSVGYKNCDDFHQYKEIILNVEDGMKFYCTTDGYLDQNGGLKDFPFGKNRFKNIIKENSNKSMLVQKEIFIKELNKYESAIVNGERNDDITVIGFEI